jgi:hypothetical protein
LALAALVVPVDSRVVRDVDRAVRDLMVTAMARKVRRRVMNRNVVLVVRMVPLLVVNPERRVDPVVSRDNPVVVLKVVLAALGQVDSSRRAREKCCRSFCVAHSN